MRELLFDLDIKDNFILKKFKNSIILDIETSGLSRKFDTIFLIGLIEIKETTKIKLLFADEPQDEIEILKSLELNKKTIITYNGDSFDLPFIKTKLETYGLDMPDFQSLDLYRYIKKFKYLLKLSSYKQKNIEEFLGINREEFISGAEVAKNYKKFLKSKDQAFVDSLLTHNKDDIKGLLECTKIIKYIDEKLSFTLGEYSFKIEDISYSNNFLEISGLSNLNLDIYHTNFDKNIELLKNKFKISLEVKEAFYDETRKCAYVLSSKNYMIKSKIDLIAPKDVYLIYLDELLFENIHHLSKEILKQTIIDYNIL